MIAPGERDAHASLCLVYDWARPYYERGGGPRTLSFTNGDSDDYTLTCTVTLENGRRLFVRLDADVPDAEIIESLERQLSSGGFL